MAEGKPERVILKLKQLLPHLAAMMSRCLLATLLLAVAASAEQHSCLGKLHLNLEKDCKWQANVSQARLPPLGTGYVPGCFKYCFEELEIFESVIHQIRAATPHRSNRTMCDSTGVKTSYLCTAFVLDCVKGDKSFSRNDFPNSCSTDSFGYSSVVGGGYAARGESWIALYAYSNYIGASSKGSNTSQRLLAARVMFRGVEGDVPGVSYDAMCEGHFEVQGSSSRCFGVEVGKAAEHEELAQAPLAPPRIKGQPAWPLPPFVPTPKTRLPQGRSEVLLSV